jgi:hypothetical protein
MYKIITPLTLILLLTACSDFDSTKIIEPTTYQINAVSLNMPREMVPTNVAAQKVEENEQFTLVGATFLRGQDELVGIWLFDESNPEDIRSINEIAQNYSPFPVQDQLKLTSEVRNLSAFLQR